jgi:hypothetical protein
MSRLRICGTILPLLQYVFMAGYLVKHRATVGRLVGIVDIL